MIPLKEVQKQAEKAGLTHFEHLGKEPLIRAIQETEGYEACFDAPWCNECKREHCRWKEDCQAVAVGF